MIDYSKLSFELNMLIVILSIAIVGLIIFGCIKTFIWWYEVDEEDNYLHGTHRNNKEATKTVENGTADNRQDD